ncbi:MAG TPA: Do family serine endopeptidase [Gemmatimonadaceae bacterium]|nr:Do family serine endopeptidase [Gemmatimonadaceae bacterium]
MKIRFDRLRRAGVFAAVFIAGVLFASKMDWTMSAHAQLPAPSAARLASGPPDFADVAARVTPAVVAIRAEHDARPAARRAQPRGRQQQPQQMPGMPQEFQRFFQFDFPNAPDARPDDGPAVATGSGFLVSKDGYILTNNHVVDDADRVTVGLPDRREFTAKVVGRDPQTDVAVLKISGANLPEPLALGDDNQARVGDWVLAVGNPLQLNFTVTAGIVSAKGRTNELRSLNDNQYAIQDFIQTDAAINPGNSGGPLVDGRGNVIGINSAIESPTGTYAGYGFAIPITLAKTVMDDLIAHGHVRRAILGALISEVTPEDKDVAKLDKIAGVKVQDFSPADASPAREAGIQRGDIIVSADGKPVSRVAELQRLIRTKAPGDKMTFDVVRYGAHHDYTVKLGEAPSDGASVAADDGNDSSDGDEAGATVAAKSIGVTVTPITADVRQSDNIKAAVHGVYISKVAPGGPAEGKLIPGDVITEVIFPKPATTVRTGADLQEALQHATSGGYVGLLVSRRSDAQGNRSTAVVNLKLDK